MYTRTNCQQNRWILFLNKDKWPQLGCRSNNWPYVKMVDELYEKLINGAGFTLSETEGPTWISIDGSKSSVLDIHLCNDSSKVKSVTTTKEYLGDHHTLIMTRSETDVMGNQQCTKRPWSKVDYIWVYCTYAVFWEENVARELFRLEDPDEVADRLTCILNTILDGKWPVKTFKVKPNYSPYVGKKLLNLRNEKRRLYKLWKKNQCRETYKALRQVSNKLRRETKKARMRYFGRRMSDYKDSDAVNKELNKKVKDILSIIPAGIDPMSFTRDWLADKVFPEVDLTRPVTQEDVEEAIKSLNITDAAGHDDGVRRDAQADGRREDRGEGSLPWVCWMLQRDRSTAESDNS